MSERSPFAVLCENFAPGYQDGAETNRRPDGATPDARNAWFETIGQNPTRATMARRPGSKLLNPTAIASGKRVDGLFEFRQIGDDPALLAVCNGDLVQFDGTDTFNTLEAAVFTAGRAARAVPFRENLFIADGSAMKRWNGTDLLDIGTDAPTAAPAGTNSAIGGGETATPGTFEGFAVWYDSVMDHESSPSAISSAIVCGAGDLRVWTKPTGSPSTEYGFWRMYVRRTDVDELNFYLATTTAIATTSQRDDTSDAARRLIGPKPNDNDKPASAFAIIAEYKGCGVGVRAAADEFQLSKQGDLQSWPARNTFGVQRGSGTPITTARPFGEDFLIQKDHASWRLEGDGVPFVLKPVHSSYGNVSQEAGLEVDGLYYAWDREKGPYTTDTINWRPLSRGRLTRILKTLTRSSLDQIRAGHSEQDRLVFWTVPVNGSSRTRVLLAYQYELDAWLPPITGLEYAALASFVDPNTDLAAAYAGDEWGRVYQLFTGDRDGVPTTSPMTTLSGTLTAATNSTLTDGTATFYTAHSGLAGTPVLVVSPSGSKQWRRVQSNTATVLTLDTTHDSVLSPVPSAGWTYYVGAIDWYWWTPVLDVNDPFIEKKTYHLYVEARSSGSTHALTVGVRVNNSAAEIGDPLTFTFQTGGAVWGTAVWGTDVWGSASNREAAKQELRRTVRSVQFGFSNYKPDERFVITAYGLTDDPQAGRRAATA